MTRDELSTARIAFTDASNRAHEAKEAYYNALQFKAFRYVEWKKAEHEYRLLQESIRPPEIVDEL